MGACNKIAIIMDMPLYPYRIYCYNQLASMGYDLTVFSVSNKQEEFKIPLHFCHHVMGFKKIGEFIKLNSFIIHDFDKFDAIIVAPNPRIIDYYRLYNKRWWNKLIGWGHMTGRTTGNKLVEIICHFIFKKFKALIFYDAHTKEEYINLGYTKEKLFVANNTQYVDPTTVFPNKERLYFLYVGRIQERKGLDIAVRAFAILKKQTEDPKLEFIIVGGGDAESLKQISKEEGVADSVKFVGPIHEQAKLGEWFSHALAYVSPGHVGLGVLHSFACGVPVITCSDRLHSVEVYNCNVENSIIIPYQVKDVSVAMRTLYNDSALQKKMSDACLKYYNEYCTIDKMVDGIDDAIHYTLNK